MKDGHTGVERQRQVKAKATAWGHVDHGIS